MDHSEKLNIIKKELDGMTEEQISTLLAKIEEQKAQRPGG